MPEIFLDGRVTLHCGDVLSVLRTLPADHFDICVTSPPYWGLRDYGTSRWEGGNLLCDHRESSESRTAKSVQSSTLQGSKSGIHRSHQFKAECGRCGALRIDAQLGLEPTLGEHIAIMVEVLREVRRVLKPSGSLWLNYGDCYATSPNGRSAADTKTAGNDDRTFRDKPFSTIGAIYVPDDKRANGRNVGKNKYSKDETANGRVVAGGFLKAKDLCMIPNRLAIALQDDGWWVRSEIIWGKRNGMPDSSGKYRPSTAHEKVFLLTKTANSFYDADAVSMPCSSSTHARISQDVANQVGSTRANGGAKTNGNMKAVIRKSWKGSKFDGERDRERHPDIGRNRAVPGSGSMDAALAIMPETRYLRNYEPAPLTVWPLATNAFSEAHFATFPPELVERCLKAGCPPGGRVLDPFGGSGTTAMVAASLGRTATLIELNPKYCRLARARIEAEFMGDHEGRRHMVKQLGKEVDAGPLFAPLDGRGAGG
jgi:DNA modification methylase